MAKQAKGRTDSFEVRNLFHVEGQVFADMEAAFATFKVFHILFYSVVIY